MLIQFADDKGGEALAIQERAAISERKNCNHYLGHGSKRKRIKFSCINCKVMHYTQVTRTLL